MGEYIQYCFSKINFATPAPVTAEVYNLSNSRISKFNGTVSRLTIGHNC